MNCRPHVEHIFDTNQISKKSLYSYLGGIVFNPVLSVVYIEINESVKSLGVERKQNNVVQS